jgi:hypothetical protein
MPAFESLLIFIFLIQERWYMHHIDRDFVVLLYCSD